MPESLELSSLSFLSCIFPAISSRSQIQVQVESMHVHGPITRLTFISPCIPTFLNRALDQNQHRLFVFFPSFVSFTPSFPFVTWTPETGPPMDGNFIMHGCTDDRQQSKIEVKHSDDMGEACCVFGSSAVDILVVINSSGMKHATILC